MRAATEDFGFSSYQRTYCFCVFSLQAPLTTKDTAILSGSLSTHNGNGGGTINLALRRVTSAKGWGEVCCIPTGHHTHTHFVMYTINGTLCLCHSCLRGRYNMEGHFKMWNVICCVCVCAGRAWCWRRTWTSVWDEDFPKLDASIVCVEMQEKGNRYNFYHNMINLVILIFYFIASASWPLSVGSSFHPEACVLLSPQCWPAT